MSRHALGIMVSADTIHAVLLERTEEETVVQFKGSSSRAEEDSLPFEGSGGMTPGMEEESDDVTIQFGEEGGGGEDMFMGSEFDDLDGGEEDLGMSGEGELGWNFQAELDDLLDECAERGYEDPEISFCTTTSEVDRVELRLPVEESADEKVEEGENGLPLPASRSTLLEMLEEQYEGQVEEGRTGFLPMHRTSDGRQRVLALVARPMGSVLSTLESMQEHTLARSPRARIFDTEVSLYLGLVRSVLQLPPGTPEKTIFVRSGPDDTLVLFIEGNTLRELEYLPELTAEDSAETICSRVLLLQDEYGTGEVQHLMLIAEENEEVLADAFKSYFAGANLRLLRTHLPNGEETESGGFVAAKGAALRVLGDPSYESFFQSINLLAKRHTASSFRLPVGWSVPVLLGLLAITTLGFVWYYFANASAISQRRAELRSLKQEVEQVDPDVLQRRIDSLESAASQYEAANGVLETLLHGSNKWSRGLATVTERIDRIEGLTILEWSPESAREVAIVGRSTDRPKVVRLAEQLEGEILDLTFTETREVSLYDFQLTVPLDTTKPEGIEYWHEQRGERLASIDEMTQSQTEDDGTPASPAVDTTADAFSEPTSPATASAPVSGESSEYRWAVVVASLAQNAAAEEAARRFRKQVDSDEHSIQVHPSSEEERYRVALGGFSSFEAARSVLRDTSSTLPDDAWLLRTSSATEEDSVVQVSSSTVKDSVSSTSRSSTWTVVVASVEGDSVAQRIARRYRDRLSVGDHSVQVRQSAENGRYRVGVGVFSSFGAAHSALKEMQGEIPSDAWLHKYVDPELTSGEV